MLEESHAFRFIQKPYFDKVACFFVPWRLTFETNIPYDALLTGYLVLATICQMHTLALQYL